MALWKPDQTFYPSARMAMQAPRENLGYVVTFNPTPQNGRHDALCVLDLDPKSRTYSQVVSRTEVPGVGDELHHFGWNACSAALCPYAPHPHIERRYLLIPGLRSSRMYIFDTKPDPRRPKLVKTIEPEEIASRTGYSRPHTIHIWNLRNRRHLKSLDLGADQQMALELRPSHDPTKTYGFVGVVISTKDLSAAIWLWHREGEDWKVRKVIEIPAEPADEALLPPALKP